MSPMKPAGLAACLLALGACSASDPTAALGEPVDARAVLPLAAALSQASREVTLRGEVAAVCGASGCWFTLREREGERFRDLRVDLLRAAQFRLDSSALGRTVVVRGRLAGEPDPELVAVGLRFE
jgi:hypothetical protein